MIKDSGDRTEFATGAKRDMHAGKGRMDLLPWYGIMEISKHCEEGALKYGEHNVDKGIPLHSLLDSAARHLAKYMVGMDDEDHLRAACWNLLWALDQRVTHPELDDRFAAEKNKEKVEEEKSEWISYNGKCKWCNKHWIIAYGTPSDSDVAYICPNCKGINRVPLHAKYQKEQLIQVMCKGCGAHFGIPENRWNRMLTHGSHAVCNTCPCCGKEEIIMEVMDNE